MQYVGGAPGCVMQVRSQTQKEIVGAFDASLIAFTQPLSSYEWICAQRALFEVGDPKQILIIAQSATAALQVGLLQVNAIPEFFVSGHLILHAQLDVIAFASHDAFRTKL